MTISFSAMILAAGFGKRMLPLTKNTPKPLVVIKNVSLLKNKTLAPLKQFIIKKANEYIRDILEIKDQIYLVHSWSTINPTHAFHEPHEHPNAFISIVYYAQCIDGALRFHLITPSIREGFNFQYTVNKFNIYNSPTCDLLVHTGDIVLFPGHIRHGSVPNKSLTPRITIGANFFIKGKLGSEKNVSLITI